MIVGEYGQLVLLLSKPYTLDIHGICGRLGEVLRSYATRSARPLALCFAGQRRAVARSHQEALGENENHGQVASPSSRGHVFTCFEGRGKACAQHPRRRRSFDAGCGPHTLGSIAHIRPHTFAPAPGCPLPLGRYRVRYRDRYSDRYRDRYRDQYRHHYHDRSHVTYVDVTWCCARPRTLQGCDDWSRRKSQDWMALSVPAVPHHREGDWKPRYEIGCDRQQVLGREVRGRATLGRLAEGSQGPDVP